MKVVKKVEYVLKKPLRKKGEVGDVIKVAKGFGRYLETQGIAQRADEEILKTLEEKKQQWKLLEEANEKEARLLIDKVKGMEQLTVKKRVAQGDKLYDSVRPENVVAVFKAKGINLEANQIKINNQIKKLGKHSVVVHAYGNYETAIELDVVSEQEDTI